MAKYNHSFFQIPQTGLECDWPSLDPQARCPEMRMSNFGALNYGVRCAIDYTKVASGFKAKDELQNPTIPSYSQEAEYDRNPYVWGSTTKHIWNDELRIMTLGSRTMAGDRLPGMDVSDTKVAHSTPKDGNMSLNYPTEGYKPFGGRVAGPCGYRVSK